MFLNMFQAFLCPSSGGRNAFHCLWFLSCCSCCDAGESVGKMYAPCSFCPVLAVVMLESQVARCVDCAEDVAQCTHLATQLSSITTATTGQKP